VADPASAGEHDTKHDDDHNQIDPEHGEQGDKHAAMLASWPASGIIRNG
jgi:hypothetical protein